MAPVLEGLRQRAGTFEGGDMSVSRVLKAIQTLDPLACIHQRNEELGRLFHHVQISDLSAGRLLLDEDGPASSFVGCNVSTSTMQRMESVQYILYTFHNDVD